MPATKDQIQLAQQRAARAHRRLLKAAGKPPETLLIQYDTSFDGFDEEKVEEMRDQYGRNEISAQKHDSLLKKLLDAFVNPFTVVLFVLAAVSFVTDFLLPATGKDLTAVIIVVTMVAISGVLRLVQETRNEKSAQKLTEMVETTIAVQRELAVGGDPDATWTQRLEIPLDEIVVGDIVHLAAGDMIPADVRVLQAKDLFVSQSSLTGESEPVEKFAAEIPGKPSQPLDLNNLAFMGSNVVSGSAIALVLAVGDDTTFGQLARQLQEKRPETSFEKGIRSVSWVLIRFMLVMVPVILFINGFTKQDWDTDYLKKPRQWEASSITRFMLWIGPISSVFDIITFAALFWVICPALFGGMGYHDLVAAGMTTQAVAFIAFFHAGWFVESLWSQTLVIHMIRTAKIPFLQSRASWQVTVLTTLGMGFGTILPFVAFTGNALRMSAPGGPFFLFLAAIIVAYMGMVTVVKRLFVRRYGELL